MPPSIRAWWQSYCTVIAGNRPVQEFVIEEFVIEEFVIFSDFRDPMITFSDSRDPI